MQHAVLFGFLQSLLNDYNFLSPEWKENAINDRILGVSLTGARDHEILGCRKERLIQLDAMVFVSAPQAWLRELKALAKTTEAEYAALAGIPPAKAVTCVKPSGTVSQLVNSSSGLHVRYAPYYIRRVRISAVDPLAKLLIAQGVPHRPENGETINTVKTWVFSFPVKAPDSATTKKDVNAIEQLEYWKMLKECWCDHNPSCTVYVKEHEWLEVGAWVYENFDVIGGVSFFPDENGYEQAPYEEVTEEEYTALMDEFPSIDFSKLAELEHDDYTTGSQEYACAGGSCEL